jgi:hypothetical protein
MRKLTILLIAVGSLALAAVLVRFAGRAVGSDPAATTPFERAIAAAHPGQATASSHADIALLNVRDSEAVADRPGIIEVRARAHITNLGHYDGAEMWWSLLVSHDNGREPLWHQDYRHKGFRMPKGNAEFTFSQDIVMPPGEYDMWIGLHTPGDYYDKDHVTLIAKDKPLVSKLWRVVVW